MNSVRSVSGNVIDLTRERLLRDTRSQILSARATRGQLQLIKMQIEARNDPMSLADRRTIDLIKRQISKLDNLLLNRE